MLGDMNLDTNKWSDSDFLHKSVAEEVQGALAQCGLLQVDIGITYLATG